MKKVKVAQKKVDNAGTNHSKTIEPAFGGMSYGGAPSGSKTVGKNEVRGANGLTAQQESHLKILKEQLFNNNKNI